MSAPKQLQSYGFQPKERAAAKAAGEVTYFTGRPCKHGHVAQRQTDSGTCLECCKRIQRQNLDRRLAKNPNWYKDTYAKNPDKQKQKSAEYRARNPEKVRQSYLASMRKRKPQKAAAEMQRLASKLSATPKWLSKQELTWIQDYYLAARAHKESLGIVLSVDHIVPLRGKTVCGLHVPWNLCLRTKSDNSKKNNKLTLDAYLPKQRGILVAESALPWNLKKEIQNDHRL
jgi:hypothetical protein